MSEHWFCRFIVFKIINILEKCSRTLKWTRLKKWTVQKKLSRVTFLHVSSSGQELTVVVETSQCEYLLSAIIQIVKELQVRIPKVLSDIAINFICLYYSFDKFIYENIMN